MDAPMLMNSSLLLTLLTISLPLLTRLSPKTIKTSPSSITHTIKLAFLMSLVPATTFTYMGTESIISHWEWKPIMNLKIPISLKLDQYSMMFLPTALFVTWSILEFASWYMASEPHITKFFLHLLVFLIAMLLLTVANNMFLLFIGWEGVGIMSFMLIGWWHGRAEANTAALQAILYNRIGDIGLILSMAWLASSLNTWELQQTPSPSQLPILPILGLVLAATGKSAQFGLHPWLPAAMEGPTPVSALLHSSTMVVAGIFLLIRTHPMFTNNPPALSICLCLGALSTLFAATCALTQNDIKKIIAFSTSSQLGLMMVTIGLNLPQLAFFHISTHAFFKAMLFLCSGSIIHNLNGEQDIRKMGNLQKTLPTTTSCLTIGNLALMGTPFLAGFYSKDLIIETLNTSYLNSWALLLTLLATSFTATYSLRMTLLVQTGPTRMPATTPINENNPAISKPITRLAMGSIMAGLLLSSFTPPMHTPPMTMPTHTKTAAITATILGLILAMELSNLTQSLTYFFSKPPINLLHLPGLLQPPNPPYKLYKPTNLRTKNCLTPNRPILVQKTGPEGLANTQQAAAKASTTIHTGLIKTYLGSFALSTATAALLTLN
uniref:NADH-ubiquinone oxidoreductase chain 5 n=1 Tax=Caprimulgus indicus TaxID=433629 RepID=A0A0A0YNH4_9AVES